MQKSSQNIWERNQGEIPRHWEKGVVGGQYLSRSSLQKARVWMYRFVHTLPYKDKRESWLLRSNEWWGRRSKTVFGPQQVSDKRSPTPLASGIIEASLKKEGLSFNLVAGAAVPRIYQIALRRLLIPATSVPCDRIFSKGGTGELYYLQNMLAS